MDRNRLGGNENGRAERAEAGEKPQAVQAAPRKKGAVLSWVIIAAAAVVLVFALVNIIGIKSEDMANEQTYEHLKIVAQGTAEETAPADPRDRKIDFAALAEVNEDIIAWLIFQIRRSIIRSCRGETTTITSHGARVRKKTVRARSFSITAAAQTSRIPTRSSTGTV